MRYAISLNFDYESYPVVTVRCLFRRAREAFLQAGFIQDGRLFTIDLPPEQARALARQALETAADLCDLTDVHRYVKDFYGFAFEDSVNLLLPPVGQIGVEELTDLAEDFYRMPVRSDGTP